MFVRFEENLRRSLRLVGQRESLKGKVNQKHDEEEERMTEKERNKNS